VTSVERVDDVTRFRQLRPDWDSIYREDPEANLFLSWRWLAGPIEENPGHWLVLMARSGDGTPSGVLPLRLKTSWSAEHGRLRNEFQFAGRLFWSDYGGFLCLPGLEGEVLPALASSLLALSWWRLRFKGLRASSQRLETFLAPFDRDDLIVEHRTSTADDGVTNNLVSPYLTLPTTFEEYVAALPSSDQRQKIRRYLRRLDTGQIRITHTSAANQDQHVAILSSLWSTRWRHAKGAETDRLARKYGEIVARGISDEVARLAILWVDDVPVGAHASFVDWQKSRLLFFVAGRADQVTGLSPGLVLHAEAIRWAIESGLHTYDLLRGNEGYKYSLGAVDDLLHYPQVRTSNGVNRQGMLDPGCIDRAMELAGNFADRDRWEQSAVVCRQVLAVAPGHVGARRLLNTSESHEAR
jgi:CelD/BcsL family acetyltransferase involved in cellulose biosynthesis